MNGCWVLDEGQSLCFIEDDMPQRTNRVVLPSHSTTTAPNCVPQGGARISTDRCDFATTRSGCAITGSKTTSSSDEQARIATESDINIHNMAVTTFSTDHATFQPNLPHMDCNEQFTSPSSGSSTGSSTRKRSFGASSVRTPSEIAPVSRKRRPSQMQVALQPNVRINLLDEFLLSPVRNMDLVMGYNTRLPYSRFDGYIHALRQLIKCSAEKSTLGNNLKRALTAEGVLWAVRESWPAAEGYWNLTATFKGFLYAELWRNFPCERTYRQLPPEYRPSKVQLMVPHSPMIDWMPWPDLRDLAIRYQDQIDTDEMFRVAILNVVAHRKKLVGSPPASSPASLDNKSFRVWDLVCLEKSNGVNPLADAGLTKKPVLHSPSARALVRAFDLEYDQFATQKLDDTFFEAFPSLYCDTAASSWQVETFQTILPEDVGYPVDLTSSAVNRLKSRFESLIGTSIEV